MTNFVISQIRTIVPVVVGMIVSWLSARGVDVDSETTAAAITLLTGAASTAYYLIVRLLEEKVSSKFGLLLGSTKTPTY